jgi:hypothetical protein
VARSLEAIHERRGGYLDLASDFAEVVEAAAGEVQELAPLVRLGIRGAARLVHELEHQGPARADVGAPRKEVTADERLEDAGLAAALAPHHGHLRQVDRRAAPELREDVLQLVDDRDHRRPHRRRGRGRCRRRRGLRGGGEVVIGHGRDRAEARRAPPLSLGFLAEDVGKGIGGSKAFFSFVFFRFWGWDLNSEVWRGVSDLLGEDVRANYIYNLRLLASGNKKDVFVRLGEQRRFLTRKTTTAVNLAEP